MNNMASKKHTFNLIDFLIVLTAIALVFALINYFLHNNNIFSSKNNSNINFVLKLDNVSKDFHGNIKIGDTVYDSKTEQIMGVITRLEYNDCIEYSYNKNTHSFVKNTLPQNETIYITINSDANFENGRYYIGNDYICAGKTVYIRLPKYSADTICTGIRQVR